MMNQMGGLIELVLVFAFVLAFGVVELRSIRRDKRRAEDASGRQQSSARVSKNGDPSN